jgi:hypothetical protein
MRQPDADQGGAQYGDWVVIVIVPETMGPPLEVKFWLPPVSAKVTVVGAAVLGDEMTRRTTRRTAKVTRRCMGNHTS